MALESLLHVTQKGMQMKAVNVTDEIAFSRKRFLCNTVDNKEIITGGISAVYAVRPLDGANPQPRFLPSRLYIHMCLFPAAEKACEAYKRRQMTRPAGFAGCRVFRQGLDEYPGKSHAV